MKMAILILAILLSGSLTCMYLAPWLLAYIVYRIRRQSKHPVPFPCVSTDAQDQYIRNFQATKSSTQFTFSWEIVDGYYSSSDISYFHLYYQHRSSTSTLYISYSSASSYSRYFSYTSPLETFPNGPYIMWLRVYRPSLEPRYTYSEKQYVKIGK